MNDDLILEAINGLARRIEKLDDKIDSVNVSLNEKIDNLDMTLNAKIDNVNESLSEKIDNLDAKMEHKIGILQANLEDFKRETRENFKGVGMALNTAMLTLDRQIKEVKESNDMEHQEFKKVLKIG